jgi:CO/xanthine dehydrogenase FAD-binding subunit
MRTAVSALDLRRASELDDALRMLSEEARTPIAGATDLYVALNFGTLAPRRFVDIWGDHSFAARCRASADAD